MVGGEFGVWGEFTGFLGGVQKFQPENLKIRTLLRQKQNADCYFMRGGLPERADSVV